MIEFNPRIHWRSRPVTFRDKSSELALCLLTVLLLAGAISILFTSSARADTDPAKYGLPDFRPLVKSNAMAVVNISTGQAAQPRARDDSDQPEAPKPENETEDQSKEENSEGQRTPLEDLFGRFFEEDPSSPRRPPNGISQSLGSGFILDDEGHILTCAHVIAGATEVTVRLTDRRELNAVVVGADARSDVALLKVDAKDLPSVTIGDPDELDVGEWVLAIGSPFGFDSSATAGIVSAKGRVLPNESYIPFIQTDVAINPGNSGGPLFDLDGNVIGINAQIYSRTGGFMGLSFAVPIDLAMVVANQLKNDGRVSRGWLGVQIQEIDQKMATELKMPSPKGALIDRIIEDEPASRSDLRPGDVIVEFNGVNINQVADLPPVVGLTPAGAVAKVVVIRDGELLTLDVRIGELDEETVAIAIRRPPGQTPDSESATARDILGLAFESISDSDAKELELDGGLRVTAVNPNGASAGQIEIGDVLIQYNGETVKSVGQLDQQAADIPAGTAVPVLIKRGTRSVFLALTKPEPGGESASDSGDSDISQAPPANEADTSPVLGLSLEALSTEQASELGVEGGLRVTAIDSGAASRAGMEVGDLLVQFNGDVLQSVDQFRSMVKESPTGTSVPALVQRNSRPLFLALKTP